MTRNIEEKVLHILCSTYTLSELNQEQRHGLRIFCETWEDILINLVSISDYSHAKGKITQMTQKKHESLSIPAYLRSELFFWIAYRNREGSSFATK